VQLIRGDFIHYIPSIQKEFEGGFLVCVMVLACSFPVKKQNQKSSVLGPATLCSECRRSRDLWRRGSCSKGGQKTIPMTTGSKILQYILPNIDSISFNI
jgi:hypothetical protein